MQNQKTTNQKELLSYKPLPDGFSTLYKIKYDCCCSGLEPHLVRVWPGYWALTCPEGRRQALAWLGLEEDPEQQYAQWEKNTSETASLHSLFIWRETRIFTLWERGCRESPQPMVERKGEQAVWKTLVCIMCVWPGLSKGRASQCWG